MSVATAPHHYATVNRTGETVREFDTLSREQLARAVATAHDAFGRWRRPMNWGCWSSPTAS